MRRDVLNIGALVAMVLVLAIGGPWLLREARSLPRHTLAARGDQRVVTLEVGGMTCSGCASAIQASLGTVTGVSDVAVRLQQRRAYIVCERSVADTSLLSAVHRAGPGFLAAVAAR